ncbi:MAG: AAA family ATPase [Planctomycetaceae bacterium]
MSDRLPAGAASVRKTFDMYEQYWGLNSHPFRNALDPAFFFRADAHQTALLKLRYLIENRLGAGVLLGGSGSGKTLLLTMLAHELSESLGPFVHVAFPQLSPAELLGYLADELASDESTGSSGDGGLDRTVRRIEQHLAQQMKQGRHTTIVIDDAHLIDDPEVFQTLRLLLNFAERGEVALSLILAGDWQLAPRIERIGALNERIAVRAVVRPLSQAETADYVAHRLRVAGARAPIFDAAALQAVFEISGGVPRRINRLCDLALLVAFSDQREQIAAKDVEDVEGELSIGSAA